MTTDPYWDKPWGERKFRGETSMNIPEMLKWSNKTTLIVGVGLFIALATVFVIANRADILYCPQCGTPIQLGDPLPAEVMCSGCRSVLLPRMSRG